MPEAALFTEFRRELHRFPEISSQEFETQQRIKAFVSPFNPDQLTEVGKTGLLLQYGQAADGPVTLIRADIDALPIQEVNAFAHRSLRPGISHKCGHDGHTAILARLASLLAENPVRKGRVYLVFQPAEETGEGAKAVLNDPVWRDPVWRNPVWRDPVFNGPASSGIQPDRVFALHNLPGFPEGVIVCKPGPFTPAVQSLIVTFRGKVSHSAEPEKGINPAYAMAQFTLKSNELQNTDVASDDFALITPIHTIMGEKSYGVSAGYGEVHLTLRTRTSPNMTQLTQQLIQLATDLGTASGLDVQTDITEVFYANQNDPEAFEQIRASAHRLGFPFIERSEPFKWGEDFGLFTQHHRGAMFGIGAGEASPALHNDDYDFNDQLIEPAARLFLELIALEHF